MPEVRSKAPSPLPHRAIGSRLEAVHSGAGPSAPPLLHLSPILLSIAFTGQCLLDAALLARLQIKGVSLDFPDNVVLQDFPLEAAKRVFQRLAFLELYFSQLVPPALTMILDSFPRIRGLSRSFRLP